MKRTRKGFTLVELLIVIAILGALSAGMSVSSSKATAAAKVTTIYNNITSIKTAAVLYQLQEGNEFKEVNATAENLKKADLVDVESYNSGKETSKPNTILYKIVAAAGKGTYVICKFADDSDADVIAETLKGYKNIRLDETNKTVGAFLYHNTAATQTTGDDAPSYETAFTYPSA